MATRINVPPVTRLLLGLLLALSVLTGAIRYSQWRRIRAHRSGPADTPRWSDVQVPYLTLQVDSVIFYPWVLLTAALVERNVVSLIVSGATIFVGGRYLERAWGSAELGKFVALTVFVSNVVAGGVVMAEQVTMRNERSTDRRTTLGGAVGLQSGFLVALKQLVPEHTVAMANGLLKVRVKHLPASFLLAQTIVGVVLRDDGDVVLAWMGFYVSWIYLRFYKARPDPSSASASGQGPSAGGDGSDSFTLAAFFPHPISVAVAAVSDRVYDVLMATRRCAPFSADDGHEQAMAREEAGLTRLADHRPGRRGGGKREEAERRRALALRALDQRLHAVANRPATAAAAAAAAVAQPHHATTATTYDDVHRPLLTHPAD